MFALADIKMFLIFRVKSEDMRHKPTDAPDDKRSLRHETVDDINTSFYFGAEPAALL